MSHLGNQASGVALLMAVKVLALKVSLCPYDKRFAYHHATAHLIGTGMMIGKDKSFEPVGVCSDIVFSCYDACKLLDTCIKEVSGIVINQSDTALVALPFLAPVIGIDLKFACALDIKPFITDTEINRSTACKVVLRGIFLTYIVKPTSGSVHVNGYSLERIRKKEIPYLRRTVGVVFQDFRLIDNMTVYENVAFAMRVIGASEKEIKERVPYVLELVGMENKSNRHPGELSGGEQQRLAIARALVNNPSTIIADEPTGNLDPARSLEIMTLLQEINNLGTTLLVVTHEMDLVQRFAKRVIAIDEGLVISDGMDGYYQYENQ